MAYDENKDGNVFLPILSPSDTGKFICYADDPSKVIFGHVTLTVVGKLIYESLLFPKQNFGTSNKFHITCP